MGAITGLNISNLFWLGRYVERVFTTLNSFFKYADSFIEGGDAAYEKYLRDINVPDIYGSAEVFFKKYVFDLSNPNSIASNLDRALGNGIVLRETIKTPSLSYLQMAMDRFRACEGTEKIRYDMLPVRDDIYAFWGSIDSNMTDGDALRIIHLGKAVERADMYVRLGYPQEEISVQLENLVKHVARYSDMPIVNKAALAALEEVLREHSQIERLKRLLIDNIEKLIEVNILETVTV